MITALSYAAAPVWVNIILGGLGIGLFLEAIYGY